MPDIVVTKKQPINNTHTHVRVKAKDGVPRWIRGVIYVNGQPVSNWFPLYPKTRQDGAVVYYNRLPGVGELRVQASFEIEKRES
jgi:hypothetical protein